MGRRSLKQTTKGPRFPYKFVLTTYFHTKNQWIRHVNKTSTGFMNTSLHKSSMGGLPIAVNKLVSC